MTKVIPPSITFLNPNILEHLGEFIRWASKIVHEWKGHLESFSRPQNSKILGNICSSEQKFLVAPNGILLKQQVFFFYVYHYYRGKAGALT